MDPRRIIAIAHCSNGNSVCGNNWTKAKEFPVQTSLLIEGKEADDA